ncbi:MAG: 3-deoxy-D-manno-octulosonic acid transferase [Phycisphaerales bacterium]
MNALDVAYGLGAIALSPLWLRKSRSGWRERMGHVEQLPPPGDRRRLMIHAVSVGETNALRQLVPMLAPHTELIITTGTDTGLARATELFASVAHVRRYPLDFSASVDRFLDAVRPDAVALVELELWPNFIRACASRAIPVAVINGRLSERSFRGYSRLRPILGSTFERLAFAAVQDEHYRERFLHMGVPPERCRITGSMKWDAATLAEPGANVPGSEALAGALGIDRARPLVVAGSTGPDEESLLHTAMPPGVQLLCAPRKPERFDEAARAMPGCVRRSSTDQGSPASGRFLLDTIGELRAAYALADLVVVGRSFGRLFGSDPIEPVALGKPTIIGPRFGDFALIVDALRADNAIRVVDAVDLASTVASLLAAPDVRAAMAAAGRACIIRNRGATARHAELLRDLAGEAARRGVDERN